MATPLGLSARFGGTDLSSGAWTQTVTAGASVAESGGRLVCDPGNGASIRDSRIETAALHDMIGRTAMVELSQALNPLVGAQTIFVLRDTAAAADVRFTIRAEADGGQRMIRRTGGGFTLQTSAYDPVAHRFLRFRVEGGTLYWEVSPTGREGSWSVLSSATTASLTINEAAVEVWIGSGVFAVASGDPGDALFESFNVLPASGVRRPGKRLAALRR